MLGISTVGYTRRGFGSFLEFNVDGWLNLPCVRFSERNPAQNFYERAIRFDDLFEPLVLPLKANRYAKFEADFAEETAPVYRRQVYSFDDIDVILLEGISPVGAFLRVKRYVVRGVESGGASEEV